MSVRIPVLSTIRLFSGNNYSSKISIKKPTGMDIEPPKVDLGGMRAPYITEAAIDFLVKHPIKLFEMWFKEACNTDSIKEANAMAVATADKFGKPSVRYVLLKSYSNKGFVFFTNYNSRKGQEIAENPQVALLFYWESLCRQIRIEGPIVEISAEESDNYFHSRPKSSQISTAASEQSRVIESKEVLLTKKQELEQLYSDESAIVPKPSCWGGYLVRPTSVEFWCGRSDRLHDRIRFRRPLAGEGEQRCVHSAEDGWVYEYLAP